MALPTPNYVLMAEVTISAKMGQDPVVLPVGSFVRPINWDYLPRHILDDPGTKWINKHDVVFCYTKYGIVPIEKVYMRRT